MGQATPVRMWMTLDRRDYAGIARDLASTSCLIATDSGRPAVFVPDVDHRVQYVVPGLWFQHGAIGEHTAVPADVLIGPRRLAGLIAHPEPGVVDDIEPPVWVVHRAVAAGLVVRARAKDRAVVLGHVKIDRPGTERGGERGQRLVERLAVLPGEIVGQDPRLRSVRAEGVEEGVRHIGLEAEGLRAVDRFQQVDHRFPAMHPTPTDLSFRRQSLAVALGHVAGLAKGLGDDAGVLYGILRPFFDGSRRVYAHNTVGAHAQLAQAAGDVTGLVNHLDEAGAVLGAPHCRATADRWPDRRHHRSDDEIARGDRLG